MHSGKPQFAAATNNRWSKITRYSTAPSITDRMKGKATAHRHAATNRRKLCSAERCPEHSCGQHLPCSTPCPLPIGLISHPDEMFASQASCSEEISKSTSWTCSWRSKPHCNTFVQMTSSHCEERTENETPSAVTLPSDTQNQTHATQGADTNMTVPL